MDAACGPQYALTVAVQTLKERCFQLQNRVRTLESENISLRSKCDCTDGNYSSEVQVLQQQVMELTEKKEQLTNDVTVVTMENRKLWSRLSKLLQANKTLGSKLNQIDPTDIKESCIQVSRNPLVRSKTFTQDEPKIVQKTIDNDRLSTDLEDISLQLISALAKEKHELNCQLIELSELQSDGLLNSISYQIKDRDYPLDDDLDQHLSSLNNMYTEVTAQTRKIEQCIANFLKFQEISTEKKSKLTSSISVQTNEDETDQVPLENDSKRMCPMCDVTYASNCDVNEFVNHVQSHFLTK